MLPPTCLKIVLVNTDDFDVWSAKEYISAASYLLQMTGQRSREPVKKCDALAIKLALFCKHPPPFFFSRDIQGLHSFLGQMVHQCHVSTVEIYQRV